MDPPNPGNIDLTRTRQACRPLQTNVCRGLGRIGIAGGSTEYLRSVGLQVTVSPTPKTHLRTLRNKLYSYPEMPPFPDGDYILYCRALSHTGQKLAITFNGDGKYATVEPLGYTENQIVCPRP